MAQLKAVLLNLYAGYDDMLPFKTGSEAVIASIRLSRAYTGKTNILRVGFHGWHDELVSPYVRCHSYDESLFSQSWPRGVPHDVYGPMTSVWHGSESFQLLSVVRSLGNSLAAVIVDPVQIRPRGAQSLVTDLAKEVHRQGALLIFDESKTGFRVHLSGAQALYGLTPDITILSKAIANGFPLAVVLGPSSVTMLEAEARIKGTFRYELSAIAAALATIGTLTESSAPEKLEASGSELLDGLNGTFSDAGHGLGIEAVPYHWPCMPYIHFKPEVMAIKDKYYANMIERGVLMMSSHMNYISMALSAKDIESIVDASRESLNEL